jgi:hypothetical protein
VHLQGERIGHLSQQPPCRPAVAAPPFIIGQRRGMPFDRVQDTDRPGGEGLAADLRQQRRLLSSKRATKAQIWSS